MKMANNYQILPFRFERFLNGEYLLTNEVGEFVFLTDEEFNAFVNGTLKADQEVFWELESKQILATANVDAVVSMLAVKFRTKKSILRDFTSLHMVVPTLRCNASCIYCQVARKDMNDHSADMTKSTAKKVVRSIFESPSPCIKIEFQGGDPSTDFKMVKYIIEEAEYINIFKKKDLSFVICTNISLLDRDMIAYLKKHKCDISTSLDGPKDIHNRNRPLQKISDTHSIFEEKLSLIREVWGKDNDSVSALMTTSKFSLGRFKDIVDEYIRLGFNSIFFRALNPYGFAKSFRDRISYPVEDFIQNYKEGL